MAINANCQILLRHPNKDVRSQTPKVLAFMDNKKDIHHFEAKKLRNNWIYVVPEEFARRLLANQPDRYYLLEPRELFVRVKVGPMQFKNQKVSSISNDKRFKDFDAEANEEAKAAPQAPAVEPAKPVAPVTKPVVVSPAKARSDAAAAKKNAAIEAPAAALEPEAPVETPTEPVDESGTPPDGVF